MTISLYARILLVGVALCGAAAQPTAQTPTTKTLMQHKLLNSQRLLDAVVKANFVGIAQGADALSRISEMEMLSWQLAVQPEYQKQATLFVLSVRGLREAADHRNLEAALAEYSSLIGSCARCHAHVNRQRRVAIEPAPRR